MEASVYNAAGENIGTVALDDALFGITPNRAVMHQAFVRQQANARHGTHDTKTRGEVRGGGNPSGRHDSGSFAGEHVGAGMGQHLLFGRARFGAADVRYR